MAIRKYPLVVVDICNRAIQQIILHEGESAGSVLPFQIVNNGVPLNLSGYDVNFYLIKPDGKKVLNSCDIKSPADGLVDYTITDQTVSMSGRGLINIQLIEGAKIAYSGGIRTEIEYTGMGSDSNEEVNLFSQIVEATKTSAEKAKEYAMSALEAYTQTEQALRETKNCQTKACNCAQAAQEALALATQAKKDAAAYATNAQTSADLAETSANAAEQSTADAAASAVAAKTSETNAKTSETAAADSAADANQSKVAAKASADSAKANADNAAISATTAGARATTATNKAAEAAASATAAKGSQDAAALSAQAADAKATAAIGSANTAERASNSAGVAATAAFNNANEAKTSADKAKASETGAETAKAQAQTIADNLQGTVDAANQATTRANTAAERAEQAAQTVQPDATKTSKGIVQIGDGINIDGGVISVPAPDLSSKADKVHKHSTADINGLDAALNEAGKVKSVNGQTGDVTIDLNKKVDKVSGKGLSTNDYTSAEKDKLAGIAEGANNYTLPVASASILGGVKVGDGINVSAEGKISVQVADGANPGLSLNNYTAEDKDKLARIEAEANKFDLKPASAQMLGGIKVGTNLSIAADGTLKATDTTYNPATPTSPGLMSAADKVAVDGIGSASEAPSVMDKSSVWAGMESVSTRLDGLTLKTMTQAEYDALSTKDTKTVYLIYEQV